MVIQTGPPARPESPQWYPKSLLLCQACWSLAFCFRCSGHTWSPLGLGTGFGSFAFKSELKTEPTPVVQLRARVIIQPEKSFPTSSNLNILQFWVRKFKLSQDPPDLWIKHRAQRWLPLAAVALWELGIYTGPLERGGSRNCRNLDASCCKNHPFTSRSL